VGGRRDHERLKTRERATSLPKGAKKTLRLTKKEVKKPHSRNGGVKSRSNQEMVPGSGQGGGKVTGGRGCGELSPRKNFPKAASRKLGIEPQFTRTTGKDRTRMDQSGGAGSSSWKKRENKKLKTVTINARKNGETSGSIRQKKGIAREFRIPSQKRLVAEPTLKTSDVGSEAGSMASKKGESSTKIGFQTSKARIAGGTHEKNMAGSMVGNFSGRSAEGKIAGLKQEGHSRPKANERNW